MLQQRASVEGKRGFVLPHTRALAARKNKARKLKVDHLRLFYSRPIRQGYSIFKDFVYSPPGRPSKCHLCDLGKLDN
jgi:hypothetical protein